MMKIAITNRMKKPASQIELGLEEQMDDLYSWTAHVTNFYEDGPDDTLILINNASRFVLYAFPVDTSSWKNLSTEAMENLLLAYIKRGLEKANFSKKAIDQYLKKVGKPLLLKNQGRQRTAWFTMAMRYIIAQVTKKPDFHERTEELEYLSDALFKVGEDYQFSFEYFQGLLAEELGHGVFEADVFDLSIDLDAGAYTVHRLIRVPATSSFADLHTFIQKAFGWENDHLYQFELEKSRKEWIFTEVYSDFEDPRLSEAGDYQLKDFLRKGKKLTYIYDMGDYWEHEIQVVDAIKGYQEEVPVLLAAEYQTPPEDVGGPGGFMNFLEALENSNDPQHGDMVDWYGDRTWRREYWSLHKLPRPLRDVL